MAWSVGLPPGANEAVPLMHGGVLFVLSYKDIVQALDATSGNLLWQYTYRLPKKALQSATRMAVLSKFADNEVTVVDDLTPSAAKTKEMAGILRALKLEGVSCLIGTQGLQPAVPKNGQLHKNPEGCPKTAFRGVTLGGFFDDC